MLKSEKVQLLTVFSLAFLVPFIFKQPQIVIGSLINFLLILCVSNFPFRKILPIVILPSFATLLNGALFSTLTIYIVYLIPIIAVSNAIFMLSFKYIRIDFLKVFIAALLKTSFLFSLAYLLFSWGILPEIFLTTMGVVQFFTALIGGVLAQILLNGIKRK